MDVLSGYSQTSRWRGHEAAKGRQETREKAYPLKTGERSNPGNTSTTLDGGGWEGSANMCHRERKKKHGKYRHTRSVGGGVEMYLSLKDQLRKFAQSRAIV